MLEEKETIHFNLDNINSMQNHMDNIQEAKRKMNSIEKIKKKVNDIHSKMESNSCNNNSILQASKKKNKQSPLPLTMNDLKINIDDNKNLKIEGFMTNLISNVFENNNTLFLYCKYVLLFYGRELIDEKYVDLLDFEIIKGGITNILVKVYDKSKDKKYLIRLYGPKTSEIINREREMEISNILYEKKISKKTYVFFPNGRIEEYLEGNALSHEDLRNKELQEKIAVKLKILHEVKLAENLLKNLKILQNIDDHQSSFLWPTIWKYFGLLNDEKNLKPPYNSNSSILNLIDFNSLKEIIIEVEKLCKQKNSPIVLCHCDLLAANIIIDNNNSPCFIDFEYACPMERAFDIANHFNEYSGFNLEWRLLPTRSEEYHFIKSYLKTDDDTLISKVIDEIQPFYVASNLLWGLWSFLQALHSSIDFDFIPYAVRRLESMFLPIFRSKLYRN